MRTTRLSLVAASLVLLGGMSAACGDDSKDEDTKGDSSNSASPTPGTESEDAESQGTEEESPSTDESIPATSGENAEFCQAVIAAGQAEQSGDFAQAQEAWEELHKVPTPADIPADAKAGYEWYYELLTGSKDKAEAEKKIQGNEEDVKNFQAFRTWIGPACASAVAPDQQ